MTHDHGRDADPLRVLADIYMDLDQSTSARIDAAKAAAQYVHPKRSSIDVTQEGNRPQNSIEDMHLLIMQNPELLIHFQAIALGTSAPVVDPAKMIEGKSEEILDDESDDEC